MQNKEISTKTLKRQKRTTFKAYKSVWTLVNKRRGASNEDLA
jgi:hypothetical protein